MPSKRTKKRCPYCRALLQSVSLEAHVKKDCSRWHNPRISNESDYLASSIPRTIAFQEQNVVFSGHGPFEPTKLALLLPPSSSLYYEATAPAKVNLDVIVLGEEDYSRNVIRSICETSVKPPRFLPQQGFVDELLFGVDWWNVKVDLLNSCLGHHRGLSYAKFCYEDTFRWPGTQAPESTGSKAAEIDFRTSTPLFDRGYSMADGYSAEAQKKRWSILKKATRELGLKEVAYTIARHCRRCKSQKGGREKYARAIKEWESDLVRLKKAYYEPMRRGAKFTWPHTELQNDSAKRTLQ